MIFDDHVNFWGVAMKYFTRAAGIVSGVMLLLAIFGSSVASADAYAGRTYAEAAGKIAENNGKAIIATVTGSQLDTNDCIVVSSHRGIFLDSSGDTRRSEYYLNLNCNQHLASPGHPGNSLSSPAGRQGKHDEALATKIAKDPALPWCTEHAARCQQVCKDTGLCDYEA
jgi:hypothetical protein